MMAKQPGLDRDGIRLREVPLDLGMANAFADTRRRIAYERLLLDLIEGDPTLFDRRDDWDGRRDTARRFVERERNWHANVANYAPIYECLTERAA